MPELPRGTVTLLFTDIEGSTRLLEELGRDRSRPPQRARCGYGRAAVAEANGRQAAGSIQRRTVAGATANSAETAESDSGAVGVGATLDI